MTSHRLQRLELELRWRLLRMLRPLPPCLRDSPSCRRSLRVLMQRIRVEVESEAEAATEVAGVVGRSGGGCGCAPSQRCSQLTSRGSVVNASQSRVEQAVEGGRESRQAAAGERAACNRREPKPHRAQQQQHNKQANKQQRSTARSRHTQRQRAANSHLQLAVRQQTHSEPATVPCSRRLVRSSCIHRPATHLAVSLPLCGCCVSGVRGFVDKPLVGIGVSRVTPAASARQLLPCLGVSGRHE